MHIFTYTYSFYYGWIGTFIAYDIFAIQPERWHLPVFVFCAINSLYPILQTKLKQPIKWFSYYPAWTLTLVFLCQYQLKSLQEPWFLVVLGIAIVALYPLFICHMNPRCEKHYKPFVYLFVYGTFIISWIICGAQNTYFPAAVMTCILANEALIAYPLAYRFQVHLEAKTP